MKEPEFKVGDRVYFITVAEEAHPVYHLSYLLAKASNLDVDFVIYGVIKAIEETHKIDEFMDHYSEFYDIQNIQVSKIFWMKEETLYSTFKNIKPEFMALSKEELKAKILRYVQVQLEKLNNDCAELTEELNKLLNSNEVKSK